jgi:ubiquitin carboxyl-terminal hydrolase 25/28
VHDGNATTGHYYSFIYDSFKKKWFRYSDIKIMEVPEEEVFKVSEGDENSWQSAYWLVYINKDISA